jgi:hypothetical protein
MTFKHKVPTRVYLHHESYELTSVHMETRVFRFKLNEERLVPPSEELSLRKLTFLLQIYAYSICFSLS